MLGVYGLKANIIRKHIIYGSSRLGVNNINRSVANITTTNYSAFSSTFTRGNKFFELSNHLGNVLVTITDKKLAIDADGNGLADYYTADVATANDYYPFGMTMPGRKYSQANSGYRYGFNGKELDNSTGEGNLDFGDRIMDVRLGRWLASDRLTNSYPSISPYTYAINSPILFYDPNGKWVAKVDFDKATKNIV